MPIWALIYLTVITLSSLYSIKIFRTIPWFWLGEGLALVSIYALFCFSYDRLTLPDSFIYPFLMALYILYWEHWVYKNFFAFLMPGHVASAKELLFTLMLTFSPLLYIMVDVGLKYFRFDI